MKKIGLGVAAVVLAAGLSAPAMAQSVTIHTGPMHPHPHRVVVVPPHHHYRTVRVCHTEWHHHHRVQICRTVRR